VLFDSPAGRISAGLARAGRSSGSRSSRSRFRRHVRACGSSSRSLTCRCRSPSG